MAVVIASDEAAHFAPGMRRSHSQPKFSSKQSGFRQSSSASRISDIYQNQQQQQQQQPQSWPEQQQLRENQAPHRSSPEPYQQIAVFSDSSASSTASSPRTSPTGDTEVASSSPSKLLVPCLRLPQRLGRPGYGSSPNGTDDGNDVDVAIDYPHYDGVSYFNPTKDFESSPSPRTMGDSDVASSNDNTLSSTGPSRTDSADFDLFEHAAEDDTAVRAMPSRHVDYLSHNWKEEDIWESWKYIVSRRGDYTNSARLENASWRTWMKSKNKLKTVSPETLNWLKDCDVTWLYGPLQTGHATLAPGQVMDSVELTKSNSFLANSKKPILKKRSMSEIMLQRSISASSLIKQAAAAVQAQQKDTGARRMPRPRLERAATDYVTFAFSSRYHNSTGMPSMLPSTSSSGIISPSTERKHIHFNEQVEQCIAVDAKEYDEDDERDRAVRQSYDSESDDGAIMMKRTTSKHRMQPRRNHSFTSNSHNESKTIAMLPSTTLKYREDTPDSLIPGSTGPAMKHSYRSPVLSPSSSQETLRPSKASGTLFFGADDDEDEDEIIDETEVVQQPDDDDDDDDDDEDDTDDEGFGMSMGGQRRRGGLKASASTSRLGNSIDSALYAQSAIGNNNSSSSGSGGGGLKRTTSTSSLTAEPTGMRRTASGMFMPYDEGEPARGENGGLVGRVIDTVNTARDIVHVIWNVGWRK